ncbi:MAG: hypothetical protein ACE5E6_03635 [Phycisphaerae bacterium]
MKVALVQITLDGTSHAVNLQGIMAAIDRAIDVVPAPDLVVLPGACDTGGRRLADGRSSADSRTMLSDRSVTRSPQPVVDAPGVAVLGACHETVALKARDWGVYIAAGMHARIGGFDRPCTLLFDANGDVVARACAIADRRAKAGPLSFWRSPVGILGVCPPIVEGRPDRAGADVTPVRGALIVRPVVSEGKVAKTGRRRPPALVAAVPGGATGAYWGVAAAAGVAAGVTRVVGPDGGVVAACDTAEQTILYADVPLDVARLSSARATSEGDGHAT